MNGLKEMALEAQLPHNFYTGEPMWMDRLEAFAKLVAAKEREACAKICYELPWKDMTQIPSNLAFAAAIRARGEA